ncbi:MAG: MtnX-like HAD-IB family phosphatase [Chloroflexi bacterium]|nr:MtnX-like HAD-IB family phosphatase [Chloroflexota bacterium]
MKLALLVDFDGTVTERDVGVMLLDAFAQEDWHRYERMFREGRVSLRECVTREYSSLPSERDMLTRFAVENAVIRPGFQQLVSHCREQDIPLTVVSGGLGFYIQAILAHHGLAGIPVVSGHADFTNGNRVRMDWDSGTVVCDLTGVCKCYYVLECASNGYKVGFIGDGSSDTCTADKADYVFARSRLQAHCEANGIPFFPFNDFHDVLSRLRALEEV